MSNTEFNNINYYDEQRYSLVPTNTGKNENFYVPFDTDKDTLMELYYGINHADEVYILRDILQNDTFNIKFIFYKENKFVDGMRSIIKFYKKYGYNIQNVSVDEIICYLENRKNYSKFYKTNYGIIEFNKLVSAYDKIVNNTSLNLTELRNYMKLLCPQSIEDRIDDNYSKDKKTIEQNKIEFNNEFEKIKNKNDKLAEEIASILLSFPIIELKDENKVLINKTINLNTKKEKKISNETNTNLFPIILFTITIIFIILIIFASTSNKTEENNDNNNNISNINNTSSVDTSSTSYNSKALENANYILNSIYNNTNKLNDKYEIYEVTPSGAILEGHYISKSEKNKSVFVVKFNNNGELTEIFITYYNDRKELVEDCYNILSSSFFNLSDSDLNILKDIINSNEEEIEKEVNNYKIKRINRGSYNGIYFYVLDSTKFANLVK